ncbi:MAG: cyclic nucleotide-binding domain-containing protein [Alphaproteobacteria bacterium]|nr:cyclic nucleotide-binding domain-containing protein [Alphaproteobacteria bacterium]
MALETEVELLRALPLFSELESEAVRLIAFSAESKSMRAGDVLFRQGDASDGGYLVISGAIALDASQNGAIAAKVVGPGALIGELALLASTRRPATAIARQTSTVLKISRALFLRAIEASPTSAERLKRLLTIQLESLTLDLEKTRKAFLE